MRERRIATVVAAAAIGILVGWAALHPSGGGAAAPAEPGPAVAAGGFRPTTEQFAGFKIESVGLVTFASERITEGNIAADDDLTTPVFSPYSGRVVQVMARLGDRVERGAPLFAVEASEFVQGTNTLIAAVATSRTARSQVTQAELNEKRAHELYLAKGGALKDWQQAQTDLAAAQNALRSADIALAAARNQLRILGKNDVEVAAIEAQPTQKLEPVTTVTAPIAGVVTQRQIGLGQYIQAVSSGASGPVFTIGDPSTVWLVANVREVDIPLMQVGAAVTVRVPAFPQRLFDAKISWLGPTLDANTHRLSVRADIANPEGALKPMMFASFSIVTGVSEKMPAIPQSAIVYEGDAARVWVARDDGTIISRTVSTGRTERGLVEIREGLSAAERVVTSGTLFLDRAGGTG